MPVIFLKSFRKQYKKLPPRSQKKFEKRLVLFMKNPQNPLLRNHELHGKFKGDRSINIGGDIRAVYRQKGPVAVFVAIGSHAELYE